MSDILETLRRVQEAEREAEAPVRSMGGLDAMRLEAMRRAAAERMRGSDPIEGLSPEQMMLLRQLQAQQEQRFLAPPSRPIGMPMFEPDMVDRIYGALGPYGDVLRSFGR